MNRRTAEVQDLYENAPAGYHSVDPEGRIMMINQTELGWLGYTREELIGRPFSDVISAASQAIFRQHFPILKTQGWIRDVEYEFCAKTARHFRGCSAPPPSTTNRAPF
ncbi:MAG: PAS domain S-box protein [Oscillochloris sp.]|nr:PAS domain S-box protein [Oscillochloris sp.]